MNAILNRMTQGPTAMDRAVGAVVGSAIGDALGAPYEFGAPDPSACARWRVAAASAGSPASGPTRQPFDWCGAVRAGLEHIDPARRDLWSARIDLAS